jgi:hypothetical protein
MKVWQLSAVVGDSDLLQRIAFRNADWHKYGQWYRDLSQIVNTQGRFAGELTLREDGSNLIIAGFDKCDLRLKARFKSRMTLEKSA